VLEQPGAELCVDAPRVADEGVGEPERQPLAFGEVTRPIAGDLADCRLV